MKSLRTVSGVLFALVVLVISGCGGGGGSSDSRCSSVHVDKSSLQFTAYQNGAVPSSQNVALTVDRDPPYIAGVAWASSADVVNWLSVSSINSSNPFTFNFAITSTDELPATYHSNVLIGITDLGGSVIDYCRVPITYTVNESITLSADPTAINMAAEPNTAVSSSLTLSASRSVGTWSSTVTYLTGTSGWLSFSPISGSGLPQSITLNAAAMPAGSYTANIEFNVDGITKTVPVSLVVKAAQVTFVAPYIATESVAADVVIRGYGFSGLASPQVTFGGTPASSATVVSDTEIHASYPALAAGSYSVVVQDGSSLPTSATLVVVPVPSYTYSAISRPTGGSSVSSDRVIYDAERQSIYVGNIDLIVSSSTYIDRVERYYFSGGNWVAGSPVDFPYPHNLNSRIALTPDGSTLLKSENAAIRHLDPTTLSVTASTSTGTAFGNVATLNIMTMSNDGFAIGDAFPQMQDTVYYRYDFVDKIFYPLGLPSGFTASGNRKLVASADGSRILAPAFTYTSEPYFYYDASSISFVETALSTLRTDAVTMDRGGVKSALSDWATVTVYDANFNSLGTLTKPTAMVMSPDGTALYTYTNSDKGLHKYDLTSPDGLGGFTQTSSTTITDLPGDNGNAAMIISPDGGSLFQIGRAHV